MPHQPFKQVLCNITPCFKPNNYSLFRLMGTATASLSNQTHYVVFQLQE